MEGKTTSQIVNIKQLVRKPSNQNRTNKTLICFRTIMKYSFQQRSPRQNHLNAKHQIWSGLPRLCADIKYCTEIDSFQLHVMWHTYRKLLNYSVNHTSPAVNPLLCVLER